RTVFQKLIEMLLATRLELGYSKQEILALYASNAPFGGNVVGLEAATWRYFGKAPALLSWAEAATLAVLPNSPALIHPGRNRKALFEKRNRLLDRLRQSGQIDEITCELAKEEPLPEKPLPLPRLAPHLLDRSYAEYIRGQNGRQSKLRSTIDRSIQAQAQRILQKHQYLLKANGIHNIAALVIEVESGAVMAYCGNVPGVGADHQESVDVIKAPRSTGSILKPFLFTAMLNEGEILPKSLAADVPTYLNGYRPENYHQSYDGMVSAERALIRSLNIPMVRMLQQYGLEKFHFNLQQLDLKHVNKSPEHYGLPLILGGAEASLWDLCNAYTCMSRTLTHFYPYDSQYDAKDFRPLNYRFGQIPPKSNRAKRLKEAPIFSANAIWQCYQAMQEVERPSSSGDWQRFQSRRRIAWKTGTSFGFRDAWAIGTTPKYTVGVWVGNADGEGRPGLVGVKAAAPVLFDLFDLLPQTDWFEQPYDEMVRIPVCRQSGFRALTHCEVDSLWVGKESLRSAGCPYHRLIHLDPSQSWQVNSDCEAPADMVHQTWFVLPPVEEHYYRSRHPNYRSLPPYRSDCEVAKVQSRPMQLIYPKSRSRIFVPVDLDGKLSRTVFKMAHRKPETTLYWHIDNEYVGQTQQFHQMEFNPSEGEHLLTVVDADGHQLQQYFEILKKE
ncbi:MAG: penicillin-binding protein 1C, partial [Bacteroidota bacterium]